MMMMTLRKHAERPRFGIAPLYHVMPRKLPSAPADVQIDGSECYYWPDIGVVEQRLYIRRI